MSKDVIQEVEQMADGILASQNTPANNLALVEDDLFLTAEDILAADDITYEVVHVPEWSNGKTDKVLVGALTATERDEFEASLIVGRGANQTLSTKDIRAKLVQRCLFGKDRKPLFTSKQIAALGKKSAAAMDRVYEVAARLSKISQKDVDDLAGKSESTDSDDS